MTVICHIWNHETQQYVNNTEVVGIYQSRQYTSNINMITEVLIDNGVVHLYRGRIDLLS